VVMLERGGLRLLLGLTAAACATGLHRVATWPLPRGAVRTTAAALLTADAIGLESPAPPGPDPYKIVQDDLEYIKTSIKRMLTASKGETGSALPSNGVLTMAAREFMSRKGKSFRPMLALLVGRATNPDFVTDARHTKLAVISEMIHTASLIHADVLEEDETDSTVGTLVHQEVALDVGNKVCILAGDFLLAKAAVELSLLESSPVTEIVARGLEAICEGGMRAYNATVVPETLGALTLDEHLVTVGESIAALIANVCQCSAILSGHEPDSIVAQACRQYGEHLAYARHLVGEAEEIEYALRKSRRNPSSLPALLPRGVHGVARAPILIAAEQHPEVRAILTGSAAGTDAPAVAAELLERSGAVQATRELAQQHANAAAEAIEALPSSPTRDALVVLCHKVVTGSPIK